MHARQGGKRSKRPKKPDASLKRGEGMRSAEQRPSLAAYPDLANLRLNIRLMLRRSKEPLMVPLTDGAVLGESLEQTY